MTSGNGKIEDAELEELFDEEGQVEQNSAGGVFANTRATRIAQVSSAMGFTPTREFNAFTVSYAKTYAVPGGNSRVARATAQFDKGVAGVDHARLKGFVVTVTAYIPADPEAIRRAAPEVMRDDLLTYAEKLGDLSLEETPAALVNIQCEGCKKETPEFFTLRNQRLCRVCFGRKMGTPPPE